MITLAQAAIVVANTFDIAIPAVTATAALVTNAFITAGPTGAAITTAMPALTVIINVITIVIITVIIIGTATAIILSLIHI